MPIIFLRKLSARQGVTLIRLSGDSRPSERIYAAALWGANVYTLGGYLESFRCSERRCRPSILAAMDMLPAQSVRTR